MYCYIECTAQDVYEQLSTVCAIQWVFIRNPNCKSLSTN